jgi:hypothetical protein
MEHELHPRAGILQVHEQVPGLLDCPRLDQVLRGAKDPDPAGAVLDRGHVKRELTFGRSRWATAS